MEKKLYMKDGFMSSNISSENKIKYINFKLAALGLPIYAGDVKDADSYFIELFDGIIKDYKEKTRRVDNNEFGVINRINAFFEDAFGDEFGKLRVVDQIFSLDHYGLARELSLPPDGDVFINDYLSSYRIKQGILCNPVHDRRTTKGSFHIVEGGFEIPYDKKVVPKEAFAKLYQAAINPPEDLKVLPFTANQEKKAKTFVSLYVKPIVSPEVPGVSEKKAMEVLFVVPGSFVTNLDFVESVFGNAGDCSYHLNDAGLDVDCWSGHTGYILLAPHLTQMKKKDLGLPHISEATERQKRDGMCYADEDELYNDGSAYKITCRDHNGVVVTIIADNYFGYSKKEIKTQLSFAANLYGNVEEEHAGGTIAFYRRNVGEYYNAMENSNLEGYSFDELKTNYESMMDLSPDNYGIDKQDHRIIYLPENVEFDLHGTKIKWQYEGTERTLKLLPSYVYILPNGEKLHMEKHPAAPAWKLVKTKAEGTFCHKPSTVSGGGKSEISKSLSNSIIYGSYYVHDLEHDLDLVEDIINRDYKSRWKDDPHRTRPSRPVLSEDRSLGSVVKLLTPSTLYTDEFNAFLDKIPNHIKALVFMVKRFYQNSWEGDWRSHFTVDIINGKPGNEIKYNNRKVRPSYLRVGFDQDQAWRVFKVRMDFMPSAKLQMEDDISTSVTIPASRLKHLNPEYSNDSFKFVVNCEYRFFQRPDEAIHKGYDKKAEEDLSSDNLFTTNYQPLTKEEVQEIKDDVMEYISYTDAVKKHIDAFLESDFKYCIISSEPRIVDGKPTKNPRYLENRMDIVEPLDSYIADIGVRLARKIPASESVIHPINAILAGRRNNPPGMEDGKKILPLSVYGPLHYQELPELFMDFISSLTGKSPSTTGAGSEGALTKGPFNMLLPIYDLNSALLSYVLGDYDVFTTPAGHIGPNMRVDHDISILIPEIWARLSEDERDPQNLIQSGALEKVEDFEYEGKLIPASRLGYRITPEFSYKYLGKIFDEPQTVFTDGMLRPETQSMEAFVDGMLNISEGHRKVAENYFKDGSIQDAIPPLKALITIMAYGEYEGKGIEDPSVRSLFDKETILQSDWYKKRLENKQAVEIRLIEKKIENLKEFIADPVNASVIEEFKYTERLEKAESALEYLKTDEYLESLIGTLGAEDLGLRTE